jgi:hypothetical protein
MRKKIMVSGDFLHYEESGEEKTVNIIKDLSDYYVFKDPITTRGESFLVDRDATAEKFLRR